MAQKANALALSLSAQLIANYEKEQTCFTTFTQGKNIKLTICFICCPLCFAVDAPEVKCFVDWTWLLLLHHTVKSAKSIPVQG